MVIPLPVKFMNGRKCYACGSDETVNSRTYRGTEYGLWYTNQPTDLVLCNKCYCYYIKNPRHNALVSDNSGGYSELHEWVRRNRLKPLVCEQCHINPPRQVANVDEIYERDIIHFKWMCVSCHAIIDGRGCGVHSPRPRIRIKRIGQEIQQKVISAHLDGYGRNKIDRLMSEQGIKVSHGSISNIINAYKREHGQSEQSQEYLAKLAKW